MNARDRVRAAIEHKEPDRIPLDFWWSHEVKERLIDHLNVEGVKELQDYLGSDIRCIYPPYIGRELPGYEDGSYMDFWGVIRKPYSHGCGEYDEVVYYPLGEAKTIEDVEEIEWPEPDWFDYGKLPSLCEEYQGYALMVGQMGVFTQTIFIQAWFLRGLHQLFFDFVENRDLVKAILHKIMEFRLEHVKRILEVVKGRVDMMQIADDYGMQSGLMISPATWREFFAPHLQDLVDLIHGAGLKTFLHCCGSCREILPELIDIGIDILNPIQPSARGMDPEELKSHFGDRICFHGGIDTQSILPKGSVEDVRLHTKEMFKRLGRGGGYIMAPVHTVEPDVPLENILALYETARRLRY